MQGHQLARDRQTRPGEQGVMGGAHLLAADVQALDNGPNKAVIPQTVLSLVQVGDLPSQILTQHLRSEVRGQRGRSAQGYHVPGVRPRKPREQGGR